MHALASLLFDSLALELAAQRRPRVDGLALISVGVVITLQGCQTAVLFLVESECRLDGHDRLSALSVR